MLDIIDHLLDNRLTSFFTKDKIISVYFHNVFKIIPNFIDFERADVKTANFYTVDYGLLAL